MQMKSKFLCSFVTLAFLVCALSVGCSGEGDMVQETDEMTFDQMAEMAAAETKAAEKAAENDGN